MRAWEADRLGPPDEVLRLVDRQSPAPGTGQVVVDVDACGLNFPDVLVCTGEYQIKPPLPLVPGVEVVGRVAEVGPGVDPAFVGTAVVGTAVIGCGGLAEQALAQAGALHPVPPCMSPAKAAAFHITYQTAYLALHVRTALEPGETLLVHAGAGGVGSAAVQLGLAAGARVIATAGGPEKVAVLKDLGADVAVDYIEDDFVDAVKAFTNGRGADVVFDPVGGEVFERSVKCLAFAGRLLPIGFASGRFPELRVNRILVDNVSVVGVNWGLYAMAHRPVTEAAHKALCDLAVAGKVDPLVSRVVALFEAPEALASLATRSSYGKVVVEVAGR